MIQTEYTEEELKEMEEMEAYQQATEMFARIGGRTMGIKLPTDKEK